MITKTPSITTSVGSEGMYDSEAWPGFISDDMEEFASKAVELYKNEDLWNKSKDNCDTLLSSKYNATILGENLILKIKELEENREEHRVENFMGSMLRHHSMASTKYMSQWIAQKNKDKEIK